MINSFSIASKHSYLTVVFLLTFLFLMLNIKISTAQEIFKTEHNEKANREAEEGHKQRRDEWLWQMHRSEPDINPYIIDQENINARNFTTNFFAKEKNKNGELFSLDTVANIVGAWQERGSNNVAGRITYADIDFNRGIIFATSAGGHIWKGRYSTVPQTKVTNWECLNDKRKFYASFIRVLNMPNNKIRVFVFGSQTAIYSDDDGKTWVESSGFNDIKSWGGWKRCVVKEKTSNIYALGVEWDYSKRWKSIPVIYGSKDFGATFKKIERDTNFANADLIDMFSQRYGSGKVYVIKDKNFYELSPNDTLLKLYTANIDTNKYSSQRLCGTEYGNGVQFYLFRREPDSTRCYGSRDNGRNFSTSMGTVGLFGDYSVSASTLYNNQVYVGGVDMWRSYSSAQNSFEQASKWGAYYGNNAELPHADIPAIIPVREPSGKEIFLCCTDGGLFISRDSLNTFRNVTLTGMNNSQYYSVYTLPVNNSIIYAGAQDQGMQRCMKDSGNLLDFSQLISGDYGQIVSGNKGVSIWYNYPGFVVYYARAHEEAFKTKSSSFKTKGQLWIPPLCADPYQSNVCWYAGGDTIDNGKATLYKLTGLDTIAWERQKLNFGDGAISALAISTINPKYRYLMTTKTQFYYSINDGTSWAKSDVTTLPGGHYFYGNAVLPSTKKLGTIYLAGSGYSTSGFLVSEDNGKTFKPMTHNLPKTLIYSIAADDNEEYIFAATEIGPYMLSLKDTTWSFMGANAASDALHWSVQYLPSSKTVRFGTYARGIWDFKIDRIITPTTSVASEQTQAIKIEAIPNVTRNNVNINFSLAKSGFASIKVFDIEGKLVQILSQKYYEKGPHNIIWDCKSNEGYRLPTGNYMCIISTEGVVDFAKIEIVK